MLDKIYVFDDIIDLDYQNKIKSVLTEEALHNNKYFPWYFIGDITASDSGNQKRRAFTHQYVDYDVGVMSDFHDLFLPLLNKACEVLEVSKASVVQGRSFLQFPLNLDSTDDDTPHIDLSEGDRHIVVLYYVVTSDGDTVIYNERTESDNYTVKQKVSPIQGRVVIFDGGLYHTAQQALKNIRCVVNYNLA